MRGRTLKEHIREKMGQPEFKKAWEELDSEFSILEGFSYKQVKDSAAYVRGLRAREGKRLNSADQFIQELKEWQKKSGLKRASSK